MASSTASARAAVVARNLQHVRSRLAEAVAASSWKQTCTLVAVSKTKPVEDLQAAYANEQRHFGENYVRLSLPLSLWLALRPSTNCVYVDPQIQELVEKAPQFPADVKWHYIGHVQSNKAKGLVRDVPNLFVVETVDSVKIANALNKASGEFRDAKLNVMVQVNTSEEEQKSGGTIQESVELAQHIVTSCEHLQLIGLMTIGRYGDTTSECFDRLVACRKQVALALKKDEKELELSMGMSGDYELAVHLYKRAMLASDPCAHTSAVGTLTVDLMRKHVRSSRIDHLRRTRLLQQAVSNRNTHSTMHGLKEHERALCGRNQLPHTNTHELAGCKGRF